MKKAPGVLAAAAASALLLAGCANSPATAIEAGGTRVSVAEIDAAAAALGAAQNVNGSSFTPNVVTYDALGLVSQKIAADRQIPLTAADRAAQLDEASQALRKDPKLTALVDRMADAKIVYSKLGADGFQSACQAVPVTLNPRYGAWEPSLCTVVADGSLSKPAPDEIGRAHV